MSHGHRYAAFFLLAAVADLSGCKKPQTFEEAMREACEYPERPEVRARLESLPPSERLGTLTKEMKQRIHNPEAQAVLFMTAPSVAERDAAISAAVTRAGITRCWMTDPPPAASGHN